MALSSSVLEEGKIQSGVIGIEQDARVTTNRLGVYLELIQVLYANVIVLRNNYRGT